MEKQGKKAVSDASDRKNRFLLVLDSDVNNLSYLSSILQRFDYHVFTATSAREAVDALTTIVPSLIITSLDVKDMDGLKLMQAIRKTRETAAVPFIAVTKQGDLVEETRSFLHGAADCLEQPVSADRLYRAVQTIVESAPRTSIRIRMLLPVKVISAPPGVPERLCTLDLSERGMFLSCPEPPDVNTRLNLLINLHGQRIPVDAAVLHSDQTGEGPYQEPGMGVAFVRIAPEDQELIRQFIASDIMRGIEPVDA